MRLTKQELDEMNTQLAAAWEAHKIWTIAELTKIDHTPETFPFKLAHLTEGNPYLDSTPTPVSYPLRRGAFEALRHHQKGNGWKANHTS